MTTIASAQPYVWPYDGAVQASRTALLIFTGDSPEPPPAEPLTRLVALAGELRGAGVRVGLMPRLGTEPLPLLAPDFTVVRPKLGAFAGSDIDLVLRMAGLTHLLIAGFPFELGADCTMREANDLGYECLAIADCCSGMATDTFAGAISSVQMSGGIFGAVADADAVSAAYLNAAASR